MVAILHYNVPDNYRYRLRAVNTGTMIICSPEDWHKARDIKWFEVMRSSEDLKKKDFVNEQLVKFEIYCGIIGKRIDSLPYFDFRRTIFV